MDGEVILTLVELKGYGGQETYKVKLFSGSTNIETGSPGAGVGQLKTCTVPPNSVQLLQQGLEGTNENGDIKYASLCADLVDMNEVTPGIVLVIVVVLPQTRDSLASMKISVSVNETPL
jgi:hypothetical protein